MQEADFQMTNSAMNTSRFLGDETLLVKFYLHPKLKRKESQAAQRPIYADTPYIQIMQPGSKDSIIIRPATQMDMDRFPDHWQKFKARESQEVVGTRISDWSGATRSQAEELRFLNIMTLEQLVATSDANSQGIMGFNLMKSKAVAFLENAEEGAAAEHLRQELAARDSKIEALMARLESLENDDVQQAELTPAQKGQATKRRKQAEANQTE